MATDEIQGKKYYHVESSNIKSACVQALTGLVPRGGREAVEAFSTHQESNPLLLALTTEP